MKDNRVKTNAYLEKEKERLSQEHQKDLSEYEAMMAQKDLKFNNTGKLSEKDIDDILKGMATLHKDQSLIDQNRVDRGLKSVLEDAEINIDEVIKEERKKAREEVTGFKVL